MILCKLPLLVFRAIKHLYVKLLLLHNADLFPLMLIFDAVPYPRKPLGRCGVLSLYFHQTESPQS